MVGWEDTPPHRAKRPHAVQRRFTHREFLKGWFKS
nr:MAG TPA: hypothetical protein [Caudoviricetes sp.]